MSASDRIAAIDRMSAVELCSKAESALSSLLDVMNQETTLLRAGHWKEAEGVTSRKSALSQEYVTLARAVQRQAERISKEAPEVFKSLRAHHESLAVQMAENLRVLATARSVTESILTDVAQSVGKTKQPQTYGASGAMGQSKPQTSAGLTLNRAL